MPKIARPLTDTQIRNAKPKASEYNLAHGKGLYLRVKPNGTKMWVFNYQRPHTKQRANISLGQYPDTSLANAVTERDKCNELLAANIDPKEHRDTEKQKQQIAHQNTLAAIAELWMNTKRATLEPETAKDHWRSLELHIFPTLGKLPIHKITAPKAIKTLEPIAAKGSLETIKRLCGRLNEIMDFAVNSGIIQHNPLRGIRKAFAPATKEHYPTLKPEQLPDLMKALSVASIRLPTRCLIEWQLHTMTRPSEAAAARWDEIDFKKALWNIPAERMKKRRAHTIPLSPQALALLEVMRPISAHREFIFPSDRNPRTHTHSQTPNMALKRMGFEGLLVAHGLRALASTTLNEHGFDPDVIEAALAHGDKNEVRAAYNRAEYLERRRVLMNWWSNHIEQAGSGNNTLAANVIKLHSTRSN